MGRTTQGLIAALAFLACWGAALACWPTVRSDPGAGEIIACLFALPLALRTAIWFGARLVPRRPSPPAPVSASPAPVPATPPVAPSLAILAAALRSPHAASVEALAAAIDDDREGFPVMAARSGAAKDDVLAWLQSNGMAGLRFGEPQWRALTLASGVATELALHAATALRPVDGACPLLQLVPVLPPDWPLEQRRAAGLWLGHVVAQSGWPSACILVTADALADDANVAPSALFGRIARDAARKATPLVACVIACAAQVGEPSVGQCTADGRLFASSQARGLEPEGAIGLLLTDARQARSLEHTRFVLFEPVEEGRPEASADDAGRVDPNVLEELTRRVLKRGNARFTDVVTIIADTRHRMGRTLELMGYASVTLPRLDDERNIVRLGVAYGHRGTLPFMTALALARHYALLRFGSMPCVPDENPSLRLAALVQQDALET